MNFHKFVHKYTKAVFTFIIVIMVIPLVLWGYMGGGDEDSRWKGDAGVIFGSVKVSRASFELQRRQAYASHMADLVEQSPGIGRYLGQIRLPQPKPEDLRKLTWRNLILLEDARQKGIGVSEQEVWLKIRELFSEVTQPGLPPTDENYRRVAESIYGTPWETFQKWAADRAVIGKLLDAMSEAEFVEYEKVYEQVQGQQKLVRAWYGGVDPRDYAKELQPVPSEQIAKHYAANKDKYKVPEKVTVSYLMAELDEFKKRVPEPSDEDVKKYYEDHKKAEFQKEHKHEPGEEHKEDEAPQFKSFDEVRADIPDRIRKRKAEEEARKVMTDVDRELGDLAGKNGGKYPEDAFDQLKAKYKAQGIELVYDLTTPFDRKHVEEIEKSLGTGTNLATWPFETRTSEGTISQRVTTSKGILLFRLLKKKAEYVPETMTEQIRERIVKTLQKEQLQKRAQQAAQAVVQDVNQLGFAAARAKHRLEWKVTRYFKAQSGGADSGVEDAALQRALSGQAAALQPGKAAVILSSMVSNPQKEGWSYALYLEDAIQAPPDNLDLQVRSTRERLDREAKAKRRMDYGNELVNLAQVKEDENLAKDPAR
jgi:hypothetical protein